MFQMISSILSSRYSSVTIVVGSLLYQSTSNPIFLLAALFGVAQEIFENRNDISFEECLKISRPHLSKSFQYLYSMQDALLYQPNMPPTTRNCNPLPRTQHEVRN